MFTYQLSLDDVNLILRHLDMGAHREVRPMIDRLIAETNRQQQEQQAAQPAETEAPAAE